LYAKRLADHQGKPHVSFRVMVDLPVKVQRERLDNRRKLERAIGTWPEMSCAAARKAAIDAISIIRNGGDIREGSHGPQGLTLRQCYDHYVAEIAKAGRRPATLRQYEFTMKRWPKAWLAELMGQEHDPLEEVMSAARNAQQAR